MNALPGRVQVAGVIDRAEAEALIESGADMLGFPLGLKDGREDLSVDQATDIIAATAARATSVCITYHETAADILALCQRLGVRWVQIHGAISPSELERLRELDPALGLIKSLVVNQVSDAALLDQLQLMEPWVDAFITDTFDPATGRTGATGLTHDWAISRRVVEATRLPVILAGGLTAANVAEAVHAVRPAAVDAHTGLESADGRKDPALVRQFVSEALDALKLQAQDLD